MLTDTAAGRTARARRRKSTRATRRSSRSTRDTLRLSRGRHERGRGGGGSGWGRREEGVGDGGTGAQHASTLARREMKGKKAQKKEREGHAARGGSTAFVAAAPLIRQCQCAPPGPPDRACARPGRRPRRRRCTSCWRRACSSSPATPRQGPSRRRCRRRPAGTRRRP